VGDKVTLSPAVINLKKVSEEGGALTGAEFTLEYIRADESTVKIGTYAVDEAGELMVDGPMAGAQYKLTETKAPYGFAKLDKPVHFKVAGDGTAKISIVNAPDDVRCEEADDVYILTVINCPIPPVDVTVTKEWAGDDEAERPASVKVALQKNGEIYEEVELSAENEWTYTWEDLDGNFTWTVTEVEIPEGYTAEVTGENGVYTITNTKEQPEEIIPDEDIPQGDPDDDDDVTIEDDIPLGEPTDTGDPSILWMALAALSAGGMGVGALAGRKRK
ncbi:MAG: Cna B-type domain-containing protein, partial [Christensenellaceae bacterium]|nr:Cna B-type domain-containing protein [Christensenellaceae bacterium]